MKQVIEIKDIITHVNHQYINDGYLEVYFPGKIAQKELVEIEDFLYPPQLYDYSARRLEVQISREYLDRATIIVFRKKGKIIATCRFISKWSAEDELPIECATIDSITDPVLANRNIFHRGEKFRVQKIPGALPACEVGGLRALDPKDDPEISVRTHYHALKAVLDKCEALATEQGHKTDFCTCLGTPPLQRLYGKKFRFYEIGTVCYDPPITWKALMRRD